MAKIKNLREVAGTPQGAPLERSERGRSSERDAPAGAAGVSTPRAIAIDFTSSDSA
jgi:hypothetical protein